MKREKVSSKQIEERARQDVEYRKELFDKLLKHLRAGFTICSFSDLSERTILLYTKDFPCEFVQSEIDRACRDAAADWQMLGKRQSNGTCLGNSATWKFIMGHKYKWSDKIDLNVAHSGAVSVSVINYSPQPILGSSEEVDRS